MFIEELSKHLDNSDVNITFSKKDDIITAIVVPKPKNDKIGELSPIVATGTAKELDEQLVAFMIPIFDAVKGFKVTGVEEAVAEVEEAAKETPKLAKKEKVEKPVPVVKINAKTEFDAASKLFNEGKYSEALPLYQSASDIKPHSKPYKEAVANCQRWIDSIAKMNINNQEHHIDPGTGTIGEVIDDKMINELAEKEMSESEIILEEDEDDFAV